MTNDLNKLRMSLAGKTSVTAVKEMDYLDQDAAIRNQNYVCLSFISPEDVLKQKELHLFNRFLGTFTTQVNEMFKNLSAKYPNDRELLNNVLEMNKFIVDEAELGEQFKFFKQTRGQALEEEFYKENNFQTSMRGIKVRGTYDTYEEAKARVQQLQGKGDKFNIFIASVGCWCPWSPNPDDLQNQEYAETEVNTLMKMYNENQTKRDEVYFDRKDDLVKRAKSSASAANAANAAAAATGTPDSVAAGLESTDPWLSRKRDELGGAPVQQSDDNIKLEIVGGTDDDKNKDNVEVAVATGYVEEKINSIKI